MSSTQTFELTEIRAILPHRPPFLFVDRVICLEPFKSIVAERALRREEPHFAGHFPNEPILPGVLVTEALAQTSGLLIALSRRPAEASPAGPPERFLLAAHQMKYLHPAVPGDVLVLKSESQNDLGGLFQFRVQASVGPTVIARGSLALAKVDRRG